MYVLTENCISVLMRNAPAAMFLHVVRLATVAAKTKLGSYRYLTNEKSYANTSGTNKVPPSAPSRQRRKRSRRK